MVVQGVYTIVEIPIILKILEKLVRKKLKQT
jgi:hypothetical protein